MAAVPDYTAVSPEALLTQSTRFNGAAETAWQTAAHLEDGMYDHQGCWGTDETGSAFAERYVPTSEQLKDGIVGVVELMRTIGGGLAKAARLYQDADTASTKSVS